MQRSTTTQQQQQQQDRALPVSHHATSDGGTAPAAAAAAAVGGEDASGGVLGDDGLSGVLAAVLEPLLEMIRRSAEALSPDSPARLDDGGRLNPTAYRVGGCCTACLHVSVCMPVRYKNQNN